MIDFHRRFQYQIPEQKPEPEETKTRRPRFFAGMPDADECAAIIGLCGVLFLILKFVTLG